jgi:hypothetical protein
MLGRAHIPCVNDLICKSLMSLYSLFMPSDEPVKKSSTSRSARQSVRHVEAVSRLRWTGDLDEAVERDDAARRDYQAWPQAAAHGLHPGGVGDGQPHGHAFDGVLPEEEAREGSGQSHLCDGKEALNHYLRAAKEGT